MQKGFKQVATIRPHPENEDISGVEIYVVSRPESKQPTFPTELWHESVTPKKYETSDLGWKMVGFTLPIKNWPSAKAWKYQIHSVLSYLLTNASIVWLADEYIGYMYPPFCFNDEEGDSEVYAYMTDDEWFFNAELNKKYEPQPSENFNYLQDYVNKKLGLTEPPHLKLILNEVADTAQKIAESLEQKPASAKQPNGVTYMQNRIKELITLTRSRTSLEQGS